MSAYLFDFDGTLVDSMPAFASVVLRTLDEFNMSYPENVVEIINPMDTAAKTAYFLGLGVPAEFPNALGRHLYEEYTLTVPAKSDVTETLRELRRRGHSLHILTAGPHLTLDPCLKRLGLWELFDNIWSCDDIGADKSDPETFRKVAGLLSQPISEVIFLDDSPKATRTAKAAGMTVYGVYDDSSAAYEDEMRALCDKYIRSFRELL